MQSKIKSSRALWNILYLREQERRGGSRREAKGAGEKLREVERSRREVKGASKAIWGAKRVILRARRE